MSDLSTEEILDQAAESLVQKATEFGIDLANGGRAVAQYQIEQAQMLAAAFGQAGYAQAVDVSARNVAMFAGLVAVDQADSADARMLAFINGGLTFLSRLLGTA